MFYNWGNYTLPANFQKQPPQDFCEIIIILNIIILLHFLLKKRKYSNLM